ncbi:Uncharacterised protein [Mycobacteroides abscessus subsp. abscessus]|nr:Uncharacterised protein [Mycobacteroides abscessus subsp. abscessus]
MSNGGCVKCSAPIVYPMDAPVVPGVAYVAPLRFQRLGRVAHGELDSGRIVMGRLEIARLDNDPNAPEHGRMLFEMERGGKS